MSNTNVRKKINDTTLAIRLPQAIRDQLNLVADLQYKTPSEFLRDLAIKAVQEAQPYLVQKPNQAQPIQKGFTKPTQQQSPYYDPNDDWA